MDSSRWLGIIAGLASALAMSDGAAQLRAWTVTPSISVSGIYTDNVSLTAAPEGGEFVTTVAPAISISGRSARVAANITYSPTALFYARNSEQNHVANSLSGSANVEAVEKFFFVDANASVSQNYISVFGVRPSDLFTTTENRIETRTFSVSPYLRGQFAGGYSYELRNRNTWTGTDNDTLADVYSEQWSASLASPITLFGWSVNGVQDRTSYESRVGTPDQESSMITARLFYQPDPTLRLFVSAGREENNYTALETPAGTIQEERSYDTYGYGVLWQPTPRTSVEYEWERRFFGPAPRARFSHRTRLTAWSVSYSKDDSTFQQELLRIPAGDTRALLDSIFLARFPDPAARQQAVEQFMRSTGTPAFLTNSIAFYTEQVFVNEILQGSVAILGAQNNITFTVFASESTALTNPQATLPPELFPAAAGSVTRQHGFGVSASHRLSSFTSLVAGGNRSWAKQENPPGPSSRNDYFNLGVTHTLSPKTSLFSGATYSRFDSTAAPTAHARSVYAGLDHRF